VVLLLRGRRKEGEGKGSEEEERKGTGGTAPPLFRKFVNPRPVQDYTMHICALGSHRPIQPFQGLAAQENVARATHG